MSNTGNRNAPLGIPDSPYCSIYYMTRQLETLCLYDLLWQLSPYASPSSFELFSVVSSIDVWAMNAPGIAVAHAANIIERPMIWHAFMYPAICCPTNMFFKINWLALTRILNTSKKTERQLPVQLMIPTTLGTLSCLFSRPLIDLYLLNIVDENVNCSKRKSRVFRNPEL